MIISVELLLESTLEMNAIELDMYTHTQSVVLSIVKIVSDLIAYFLVYFYWCSFKIPSFTIPTKPCCCRFEKNTTFDSFNISFSLNKIRWIDYKLISINNKFCLHLTLIS